MKYLRKFNESSEEEIELLDDYLLEYFDKYKLIEKDKYFELDTNSNHWKRSQYKGFYSIKEVSTKYFKVKGFPNNKSGYLVTITFFFRPKDIEDEFNKDMISFINRFCDSVNFAAEARISDKTRSLNNWPFEVETSVDDVLSNGTIFDYYIAFFR
jgi:hypothetical protein